MEKVLHLNRISADNTVTSIGEICAFTYSAKRMGSAPTISATFYSFEQNAVDSNCFVTFRGERYFISKTPTSSKSNTDARYKYDLEFVSERVTLDNIYLYNMSYGDGSTSQQTTFKFSGTIHDLAERIQLSIDYSYGEKDYYKIIVDEGIDENRTVWKVIDFQDTNVTAAIQESFNTFNLPYYYTFKVNKDGTCSREFHIGNESESVIEEVFKYGAEDSLLSISRTNANYKVINKITGVGSTENLPYYYPNESPTGEHDFTSDSRLGDVDINFFLLSKHVNIDEKVELTYHTKVEYEPNIRIGYYKYTAPVGGTVKVGGTYHVLGKQAQTVTDTMQGTVGDVVGSRTSCSTYGLSCMFNLQAGGEYKFVISAEAQSTSDYFYGGVEESMTSLQLTSAENKYLGDALDNDEYSFSSGVLTINPKNDYSEAYFVFSLVYYFKSNNVSVDKVPISVSYSITDSTFAYKEDFFTCVGNDGYIYVSESGIKVSNRVDGAKINISGRKNWIIPQKSLMPPIYRKTYGNERFYLAKNEDVEVKGETNDGTEYGTSYNYDGHVFNNPFILGKQVEHILNIEDVKPTIKGATHTIGGQTYALDVFAEFAYDDNDNDEFGDDDEYKHPYFYGKLNPLGFNLFEHALEQGEMTISMTSGPCGSCNFVIGVNEKKNTVQVDSNGNLLRDKDGNVRSGRKGLQTETPQDIQNNTTDNHVWIALKKDKDTYGVIHPNATECIKPISLSDENKDTTGLVKADTFVITNILLPNKYIYNAEERLENEIKKYLMENNDEKFNFSIKFSRIYLEEHKDDVTRFLNENARITVEYFNVQQQLYVSSYTYKMSADAPLPEITVELKDSLSTNQGVLKNIADQVKMSVMSTMASVDVVAQGARAFLRKDQDDTTVHKVTARELTVNGNSEIDGDSEIGGSLAVGRRARFGDTIESQGDVTVGEYTEVLGEIQGAKINKDGSGVFKSIRANNLEVFNLIYNQIRSTSAYTSFGDSGVVTSLVVDEVTGEYKITFEEDKSQYGHPFVDDDILFGYVNEMNNFGYSESGQCWLYVTKSNIENEPWSLKVKMYLPKDCPNGENIHPTINMCLMHRGNKDGLNKKERQQTFYISSKDGCIVQLLGVTSPKLYKLMSSDNPDNYSNYGVVIGKLPEDLFNYIHKRYEYIDEDDPIVYAKYLAVQNLLQIDYAGRPIPQEVYRGDWNKTTAVNEPYRRTDNIYDTVTHNGSLWICMFNETTEEPKENIAEWQKKVSKGDDSTAVIYTLKPSSNIVYYRTASKTLSVDELTVKVSVAGNGEYYDIADQNTIEQAGLSVYYALDGEGEQILLNISPDGEILLENGSGFIESEDGSDLLLEGKVLDITKIKDNITLYLKDLETGEMRASYVIPVIKDGEEGKQGRMLYPAGVYDDTREYKIENNSAPFVKEGNTYYVLVYEGGKVIGIDPSEDSKNNGGHWKQFTYMNYLFAEFLMANWAQFGSENGGVFYDKWLFSQQGRVDGATEDSLYDKNVIGTDGEFSAWKPNLALDFKKGRLLAKDADITGNINATSGSFAGTLSGATGDFSGKITAIDGEIGGFQIGPNSIGYINTSALDLTDIEIKKEYIAFANTNSLQKAFAAFGTKAWMSGFTTKQANFAIINNSRSTTPKYGVYVDIDSEGAKNFAFASKGGSIVTNTWMGGYGVTRRTLTSDSGVISMTSQNPFLQIIKFDGHSIFLPTVSAVQGCLGEDATSFCIKMTIIASKSTSSNGKINGRNISLDATYPRIVGNDGEDLDNISIGAGDVVEFLLDYDDSAATYYAYVLNRQTETD